MHYAIAAIRRAVVSRDEAPIKVCPHKTSGEGNASPKGGNSRVEVWGMNKTCNRNKLLMEHQSLNVKSISLESY